MPGLAVVSIRTGYLPNAASWQRLLLERGDLAWGPVVSRPRRAGADPVATDFRVALAAHDGALPGRGRGYDPEASAAVVPAPAIYGEKREGNEPAGFRIYREP